MFTYFMLAELRSCVKVEWPSLISLMVSVDASNIEATNFPTVQPVWPSGKALGW